jgi:hypothetical protein
MISYGLENTSGGIFLYSNPGDLEDDYDEAISQHGVEIANNSIGTNTAPNGFPCDITGNYGVTANLIDTIVRGDGSNPKFTQPFRVIWANGNERQTSRCGDTYSTTAPPAGAKNHITVGAVNSNNDSMTTFSSWGPVDDGRMKPDICAPGCQSNDDEGVTSCSSDSTTAYATHCGTSMACPTVTGCCALLLEDWKSRFPALPLPRNSTLKVLLAHTAQDLGNTGPDYQFGYGSVRIVRAIGLMRRDNFAENVLTQGGSYVRNVQMDGATDLKITLAWDDAPGSPNVNPALVNDLDLRVYAPNGTRHYPWTLNPANPSSPATRNTENVRDNIEQVFVSNAAAGTWTVEVYGSNVPQGPQTFSVCGNGIVNVATNITFPNGQPETVLPATTVDVDVDILAIGETIVPGSPTLHYRFYDGGTFQTTPLTHISGTLYRATLPAAGCGDTPQYYITVQSTVSGTVRSPAGAPTYTYGYEVGEYVTVMHYDFQTGGNDWTVTGSASDGHWDVGVPVNCDRGDPASDYDGSGNCFLTDNDSGNQCNSDVDNGYTVLTSPVIDLSGGDAEISYAVYYSNDHGADPNNDLFVVRVSNNNGATWQNVLTLGPESPSAWQTRSFLVSNFVTPTSQVRVQFEASDLNDGSVVEAGVDAFLVERFQCDGASGACCLVNGDCVIASPSGCQGSGGVYQGDGTTCTPNPCPEPVGACCYSNGVCQVQTQTACTGGWLGAGTVCDPNPCPLPSGACCFPDSTCYVMTEPDCTGTWMGPGVGCNSVICKGACCQPDGTCALEWENDCTGSYQGIGVLCSPNPCPQPDGACCYPDGSCAVIAYADCTGVWQGAGVSCDPNPCPQPNGACCYPDGSCAVTPEAGCTGTWQGAGVSCDPNPCPQPICSGDCNCDDVINWQDIDFFVAAMNDNVAAWEAMFGAGGPPCDFDNCDVDGDGAVNWRDIDPFVALMNTACP